MYMLYKFLLSLLHFIYSCIETLLLFWCFVRRKYEQHYLYSSQDNFYFITKCIDRVKTVPSHIAFLLINEENILSIQDLANLIIWSLAAGISIISIYDHDGLLKKYESKIKREIISRGFGQNALFINYKSETNGCSNGTTNEMNGTHKNGFKKNGFLNKIQVIFLSAEDSGEMFAKAAAHFTDQIIDRKDVNTLLKQTNNALSACYQKNGNVDLTKYNEPDLAVCCGKIRSVAGFLPWHIRVTEFIRIRSHKDISVHDFTSILCTYSKVEQRYGT